MPDRKLALHCALINQLATPGLGSLLARRYVAGSGQLLLACAGFGLIMARLLQHFAGLWRQLQDLPPAPVKHPWMGKTGVLLFAVAWLWALATSWQVWRAAPPAPPPVPPS